MTCPCDYATIPPQLLISAFFNFMVSEVVSSRAKSGWRAVVLLIKSGSVYGTLF